MLEMGCIAAAAQNTLIKSIQEFEVSIPNAGSSNTYSPSPAITKNYTVPIYRGHRVANGQTSSRDQYQPRVELTSDTVLTASTGAVSSTGARPVSAALIELFPFALRHTGATPHLQHGTITISATQGSNSATPSFTPVVDTNTFCVMLGLTTDQATQQLDRTQAEIRYDFALNSIIADRGTDAVTGSVIVSYCLFEFNPGIVKSKQEVLVTLPSGQTGANVTVSSTTNSISFYGGYQAAGAFQEDEPAIWQNSATQVRAQRFTTPSHIAKQRITICELYPKWIKQVQRGQTIFGDADTTLDNPISSTVVAKSFLNWLGHYQHNEFSSLGYTRTSGALQSTIAARQQRTSTSATRNPTLSWEVPEFY